MHVYFWYSAALFSFAVDTPIETGELGREHAVHLQERGLGEQTPKNTVETKE